MKRVAIKVFLEREIWIDKDVWEKDFGGELPCDMEQLDELEDECSRTNTELKKAEFISEVELTD